MRLTWRGAWLLGGTLLGAAPLAAQETRSVVTPDGSHFLLVHRPGRPVVHWASFVRMGRVHEPVGWTGVAEAAVLASLAGTSRHGTSDPTAEATALDSLDVAASKLAAAETSGASEEEIDGLRRERDAAARRAIAIADRWHFRRLLASLPATDPVVHGRVDGTLLQTSTAPEQLFDLAVLMHSRRNEAVLRSFLDTHAEVRRRRTSSRENPLHLRALGLLAFDLHPVRRSLVLPSDADPFVSRADALAFYRRHQQPARTWTVVLGPIDLDDVEARLGQIFAAAPVVAAAPALPAEPPQRGRRSVEIETIDAPRIVLGWRVPRGADAHALQVLAELVASGPGSDLHDLFVAERGLATEIEAHPRFPGLADPTLFVVAATGTDASYGELRAEIDRYFAGLRAAGPHPPSIERALARTGMKRRRLAEDPAALAAQLAFEQAFPWGPEEPTADAIRELASELFEPARSNEVRSRTGKDR